VWQALHFSLVTGVAFLGLVPLAPWLMSCTGHDSVVQELEVTYFQCLCFGVLPALIVAAISGFFAGRGDSVTVMLLNGTGLVVNAVLDYLLIFGHGGLPALGIAGAGWATVAGNCAAAVLALALFLRKKYREQYATLAGWRFERELSGRLLYFGLPAGVQWLLDGLAFTVFLVLVGQLGVVPGAATSIAVTLNLLAYLPPMGIGQAVAVLVGQRIGEGRVELAERTTWAGFRLAWVLMAGVALLYVVAPGPLVALFETETADGNWSEVAALVPVLLRFVAAYCLFDSMNAVFSFALRGAGDTRFVTVAALILSWVVMVVPTWLSVKLGWGLYWAWFFGSAYVIALALTMMLRFRAGWWKAMRVIEPAVN
jgi:MATE family multidrug resistance protein